MCLSAITEIRPPNTDVVKAYKMVVKVRHSYFTLYRTPFRRVLVELGGKWERSVDPPSYSIGFLCPKKEQYFRYPCGFHAFAVLKAARSFANLNGFQILEVELRNIRAVGIDRHRKTYVAQEQRAIREIPVTPRKKKV